MKTIEGDLIALAMSGQFEVIVHGCNCMHTMGAGIARTIKTKFPEVFEADRQTEAGTRSKLGSISAAKVQRGQHAFVVVNAYTQFDWRGKGLKADYDAIRMAMHEVKRQFSGKSIGYPLIGAGLAGGDWGVISTIIEEALAGEDHTLVIYKP